MLSHCENKSKGRIQSEPQKYIKFTTQNMVRVYPHGFRINSSNFSPLEHWAVGAQLVALNYQSSNSIEMEFNRALFALNGGCGYVLKPHHLRAASNVTKKQQLKLKIFSVKVGGQEFTDLNSSDYYVTVEFYAASRSKEEFSTSNGLFRFLYSPVSEYEFSDIEHPELTFVKFILKEKTFGGMFSKTIGTCMISVKAMKEGNRLISVIKTILLTSFFACFRKSNCVTTK